MRKLLLATAALLFFTSSGIAQTITIGDTQIESAEDNGNGNLLLLQQATLTQSAIVNSLSFYTTNHSGNLQLGIYDASGPGGSPGNLLAVTVDGATVTGWNTQSVVAPVTLVPGTYWLAYLPSSDHLAFRKQNHSGPCWMISVSYRSGMPTTFPTNPSSCTPTTWSFYATLIPTAPPIPLDRHTVWQPGVTYNTDGIPGRTDVYMTLSPTGGDDTAAIQEALDGCLPGTVVQLTAGVFNITGNGLHFVSPNCTLRGVGPGKGLSTGINGVASGNTNAETFAVDSSATQLIKADRVTNPSYAILYIGYNPGQFSTSIDFAADATQGSNSLTLTSNPGIQVGEIVLVDMITDNDPDVFWGLAHDPPGGGSRRWFMRQDRSINQIMEVTAVDGNTITFATPFHHTFTVAEQAQVSRYAQPVVQGIGIEDIFFFGGMGGDFHGNVSMGLCAYCWIKHIEAFWSVGTSVGLYGTYRSELRDSYIHESAGPNPGGAGYFTGLNYGASDNLFENNIMWSGNKEIVMRATGGGNVIAYNYMDDSFGLTYPYTPEAGVNAGHYTTPHMELLEGNYSQNYKGDAYWGNSIDITVFRNQLSGLRAAHPPLNTYTSNQGGNIFPYGDYFGRTAVDIQAHSWRTNMVGNVLGFKDQSFLTYNSPTFSVAQTSWIFEDLDNSVNNSDWSHQPVYMWHIGAEQDPSGWTWVSTTYQTRLRQGNWDWYTKSQTWLGIGGTQSNPLGSPQTIPNSLYLTSAPGFFGANTWPFVDPSTGTTYTLPAKARFDAGTPNNLN
jgi:hypothetical protein